MPTVTSEPGTHDAGRDGGDTAGGALPTRPASRPSASGPRGIAKHAPGLDVLLHYQRRWLRGDLIAGLSVAAYLVPQVMAYAQLAGLPAITGLWAAIGPLLVYAILGSSRQLSAGPESTTALMTATAIGAMAITDAERYAAAAAALAVATGLVCIVGRIAKLGYLAELLSKPVLTGYMLGIAVLMIVSQLGKVTGVAIEGDNEFEEVGYLLSHLDQVKLPTLVLALSVVAALVAARRWLPRLPSTLIVMLAAVGIVLLFGAERFAVVGEIPRGLPHFALPDFAGMNLAAVLPAAAGITIVAFSDTILTARAFEGPDDREIDGSQELLAMGVANVAAGLSSGLPVSSSGSRTALGHLAGGRSHLSSVVAAATVLLTLLVLGPVLEIFPLAALGGVVIYAATRLIDVAGMRRLASFRRTELLLALATAIAVVATGVLYGIAIAVGLSLLDLLRRIARPHDAVLGFIPGLAGMHDVDDYPVSTQIPGLLIYRYDSPLFFANATDFRTRALAAVDQAADPVRWFLLNAEANVNIDSTAAEALEELRATLNERGIAFAVARVRFEVHQAMAAAGLVDTIGAEMFFPTLPSALDAYRRSETAASASAASGAESSPTRRITRQRWRTP